VSGKVIKVDLSSVGINRAVKAIDEYKVWLTRKTSVFLNRLASEGAQIAAASFSTAAYDGVNDVSVTVEDRGDKVKAVVAIGAASLFIEFGTGVTYPDNHPEAGANGMVRGGYGQGKGKQKAWGYYGEPGTNGKVIKENEKGTLVITSGNPANMPMYKTVRELEIRLNEIAREVFV
jgi:hypothetical protein